VVGELWTSIKAYLYDRTSSPLLGAIIAGLLVWNFKIVMLVFSSASYAVKVWEIDHFYSQTFFIAEALGGESWVWSNYVFCVYAMPLLTAIFYIYVFPFFSHKVFEHSYDKQIKLNNKKKVLQGSAILTQEEKENIFNDAEQIKLKSRKDVLDARNEIADLESQRDTLITEKGQLESTLEDAADENAAFATEIQSLKEQLAFYQARYENDDEAKAERMAKGKEAVSKMREKFGSTVSPSNDESVDDESETAEVEQESDLNVSFYYNATAPEQDIYLTILSALYMGERSYGSLNGSKAQLDKYLPDLLMNELIRKVDTNTFALTEQGRSFFINLKRSA
jgi:regulator of replication initiation timing